MIPTRATVHVGLVHHPVRSREGSVITTSVTNLDVHDIARASRTFGIESYVIVTPILAQRQLVEHILGYWNGGEGANRVPERAEALGRVRTSASLDELVESLRNEAGPVQVITTAARGGPRTVSFGTARAWIEQNPGRNALLLFGTGYGLTDEWLERADLHLEPIRGTTEYNHLAVRSAASIVLDRLLGVRDA